MINREKKTFPDTPYTYILARIQKLYKRQHIIKLFILYLITLVFICLV